jgi:hypothetical protein
MMVYNLLVLVKLFWPLDLYGHIRYVPVSGLTFITSITMYCIQLVYEVVVLIGDPGGDVRNGIFFEQREQ